MISAVDLLKGIAVGAGMKVITVEGANGGLHTNYEGKAQAAVDALTQEGYDFVYIHVEAPDEMGHQGHLKEKILAIEDLDRRIIAPIKAAMETAGEEFRMLVLPDHPTPIRCRTHTADPVPFVLFDSTKTYDQGCAFTEKSAKESGIVVEQGYELIQKLIGG